MIAGVGSCDIRILTACLPVKLTGLNNDTAECCTVSADELCSRMNYDICTVLESSEKIRCTEGIVYYYGKSVLMSDLCYSVYIGDIAVRIS